MENHTHWELCQSEKAGCQSTMTMSLPITDQKGVSKERY